MKHLFIALALLAAPACGKRSAIGTMLGAGVGVGAGIGLAEDDAAGAAIGAATGALVGLLIGGIADIASGDTLRCSADEPRCLD